MPNPLLGVAAATVFSSSIQANAANRAARSQQEGLRAGIASQEQATAEALLRQEPFSQAGLAVFPEIFRALGISVPQELTPGALGASRDQRALIRGNITEIDEEIQRLESDFEDTLGQKGIPIIKERERLRDRLDELNAQRDQILTQPVAEVLEEPVAGDVLGDTQAPEAQPVTEPATQPPLSQQQPESLEEVNPLVSFLRDEGFEQIQESAAAQGRLGAGGTLKDLTRFNTQLASTVVPQLQQQRFNQLFNLLGLGANVATGQATQQLQTGINTSNLLGQIGQAQAGGIIGQGQAVQSGIGGLAGILGAQQSGLFNQPQSGVSSGLTGGAGQDFQVRNTGTISNQGFTQFGGF